MNANEFGKASEQAGVGLMLGAVGKHSPVAAISSTLSLVWYWRSSTCRSNVVRAQGTLILSLGSGTPVALPRLPHPRSFESIGGSL